LVANPDPSVSLDDVVDLILIMRALGVSSPGLEEIDAATECRHPQELPVRELGFLPFRDLLLEIESLPKFACHRIGLPLPPTVHECGTDLELYAGILDRTGPAPEVYRGDAVGAASSFLRKSSS
jgi:hypothetical protein